MVRLTQSTAAKRRKETTKKTAGIIATFALGFGVVLSGQAALAAPSQEDVDNARKEVSYAEMSVAQLEIQLSAASQTAADASVAAATAGEAANKAQVRLDEAKEAAKTATAEAKKAQEAYAVGLKDFASVAQVAYRGGAGSLDALAPYLEADGLASLEQRRNTVSSFGMAADNQMQQVAALSQVADLMETASDRAKAAEEDAYAEVAEKAEEAAAAAETAEQVVAETERARSAMVEELAAKRQTSVELENQRLAAAEAEREQQALDQLISNGGGTQSPSSPSPSTPSTSNPTPSTPSTPSTPTPSTPAPTPKPTPQPTPTPTPTPPPSSGTASSALSVARAQLGKPYVWGGSGPSSFDCSGLVQWSFAQVGKSVPRVASSQYYAGKQIPFSQAQAGDLIFWSSNGTAGSIYHVAFYLGGGQLLHAPKPGDVVRTASLYNVGLIMPYAVRV